MKLACAALVVLFALPAFAGDHPCKADMQRLCAGIPPGGGRLAQCMKDHEAELSDACKAKQAERKERVQDFKAACHDDLAKLCADVKPGQGRKLVCLRDHQSELSPSCAAAMQPKR